jgi:DNA polymerase IV
VKKFYGVGPKTAERMNRFGIFTGDDLRRQSLAFLQANFGKSGPWYYSIARGIDDRPVNPHRVRKSSGSETTFKIDLTAPEDIEDGVRSQADEVWDWCEKAPAFGRTVTVKIKFADFTIATRSRAGSRVDASILRSPQRCRLHFPIHAAAIGRGRSPE